MMRSFAILLLMAGAAVGQGYWQSTRQLEQVTSGLVGYWSMRTSGTNVFDEVLLRSGAVGSDGGAVGSPSFSSDGVVGPGVTFDGAARYIRVPHNARYSVTTNHTWSGWAKFAFESGGGGRIWSKYNASNSGEDTDSTARPRGYYFNLSTNSVGIGLGGNTFVQFSFAHGGAYADGKWRHHLYTQGDGWLRYYHNGVLTYETASTNIVNANLEPLTIGGSRPDTAIDFKGAIDEVRFYNRAVTSNEVRTLYLMGRKILTAKGVE